MSANEQLIEFQRHRIEALEKELGQVKKSLAEISEISTRKALDIKVILNDPNFDKLIKDVL